MATRRRCAARNSRGEPCGAWAMGDDDYCFRHSPDHVDEAAEASRLGGLRRRKEAAVEHIYEFNGFERSADVLRLLHVAALDTLSLPNSVARARTLAYIGSVASRVYAISELEQRIDVLERGLRPRLDRKGRRPR